MRILTPVGNLGSRNYVVAIMANRSHQVANEGLAWMGVRHDCLDYPLDGRKLNDPLAIVRLIPVLNKLTAAPKVVWPLTQRNVQVH